MREKKYCEKLKPLHIALLVVLPVICAAACLCVGRMALTLREVLSALLGGENCAVVRSMRLPRILLAGLGGAGLSVSGCVFQSMFSNPLATPDTLGVASGASFGAALALLMGFKLVGVQITAFVFGAAAIALTWLSGLGRRSEKNTMILSGIMIGSLLAVLPSGHPLCRGSVCRTSELVHESFIALPENSNHDMRRALSAAGLHADARFCTKDDYAVIAMVRQGLGVSIMPSLLLRGNNDGVELRPLEPPAMRTIALAYASASPGPASETFAEFAAEWVRKNGGIEE